MELTIELHLPGSDATLLTFNRDVIRIGSFKAHVELTPDVARIHGLIECHNYNNIVFVDMGYEAGTQINGKKVTNSSRSKLQLGDVIQISECKLVIQRTKVGDDERVFVPEPDPEDSPESDSRVVISSVEEHWRTVGILESMMGTLHLMRLQLSTCQAMSEDVETLRAETNALWEHTLTTLEKARRAK